MKRSGAKPTDPRRNAAAHHHRHDRKGLEIKELEEEVALLLVALTRAVCF